MPDVVLCRDCRYWRPDDAVDDRPSGWCALAASVDGEPEHPDNSGLPWVFRATDPDTYRANLVTGPDFGCLAGKVSD